MRILLTILLLPASLIAAERFDYHAVRGRAAKGPSRDLFEGEHLPLQGASRIQGMRGYGRKWSGDAHLLWDGRVGDSMTTSFEVLASAKYRIAIRLTKAVDYGIFSVQLNGHKVKQGIDLFSRKVVLTPEIDLGTFKLQSGKQNLRFTLTGANRQAVKFRKRGYLMGLDYVRIVRIDKPAKKKKPAAGVPFKQTTFANVRKLFAAHCVGCHSGKKAKGKINLTTVRSRKDLRSQAKLAERILNAVESRSMPPQKSQPTISRLQRTQLVRFMQAVIDDYLQSSQRLPPVVMRRLNRYEYNNAVRDLLQLKGDIYPLPEKVIRSSRPYFDPASGRFPTAITVGNRTLGKNQVERQILKGVVPFAMDLQAEHGFNNRGTQLSVSPILLESFVKLGRAIVHSPEFDGYCKLTADLFRAPQALSAPAQLELAEGQLRRLLWRAFRGQVDETTVRRYLVFFARELGRTRSYSTSMKNVVAAILASPRFLYILEAKQNAKGEQRLSSYELATRLSMFLWSSIPDETLLQLAKTGKLRQPKVLQAQITRMLEDPRSKALAENFARQWLRIDQLITAVPDFNRFPIYYARIGCEQWKFGLQTMVEPLLLFESILVEDRSIMLLLDSNYSYRSDELHRWYTQDQPFGNKGNRNRFGTSQQTFRRRKIISRREGGVVTTAAVLTMTSSALRTSPIKRGAWVATVVFNKPPPPPPDAVPEIEADDAAIEKKGITLRQRLKQHQESAACASCHSKIDPLGFALENFDAIGRWREKYRSGLKINASGTILGNVTFNGVVSLKDALMKRPKLFMQAFSEHMLAYALGRELQLDDRPAMDRIVRRSMQTRGKFSAIVEAIATSYPFLHKTSQTAIRRRRNPKKR